MIRLTTQDIEDIKKYSDVHLDLSSYNLTSEDMPGLVAALNYNPQIISLDLKTNEIENKGVMSLVKLQHVRHINLDFNRITDGNGMHIRALAESSFQTISLVSNMLTDVSGRIFAERSRQVAIEIDSVEFNPQGNKKLSKPVYEAIQEKCKKNQFHGADKTTNESYVINNGFIDRVVSPTLFGGSTGFGSGSVSPAISAGGPRNRHPSQ